jgi:two-component system cell cycle sensor histidine kinase/response regulator CckA
LTSQGLAHSDAITPVPEFLHGGSKVIAQSGGSAASAPKPEAFRPPRGPGPGVFAFVAALLLGLGAAWQQGLLAAPPFGFGADLAALGAWTVAALFVVLAAWGAGRRMRADDEALLVHLAAGEGGAPLMVSTPTGRVLYANRAFRALFKSQAPAEVPAAFRLADRDEDASAAIGRMLAAAGGGAQDHEELAFAFPGGGWEWHRLSVRPVAGVRGLVAWSADDVTARRELDEVRRREEALLADLLDNLPVGFFSVDGAGRIVYANETLSAWLGIGLNDIRERGLSFADFVVDSGGHEDDEDGLHGQVTLQSRTGDVFRALLMQSGRMGDGGELLYTRSIVVRDMLRKPQALDVAADVGNADAQALARRLYWLFDEAPVAIALLDLKANIADCNGAFLKMLGLHKDDVFGKPFADRLAKEDRGDVNAQLSKVVMGIMRAAHLDVRLPAPAGREIAASLYASRMEDAFGEVTGLVLHFIDTTEQKHLEVQFAQSQKMQSIGQLAGGIAHDFNNLLTAMIGFSDLLLARHGPGDPSFSDIDQIRQNAMRATGLVRQLLAYSRKQTLAPQEVNVKEKLSDLSEVLNRLLGATIELNIEHSRDLWPVRVDPVQFDQVILNLAVNARDAMPGGGTLTVRTSNLTLEEPTQRGMELAPAGEYVVIDVIDTGEGIRKEDIGRIFEPFFSTKEVGDGTGLGLSTVHGIVHQTGGHILVDSAPGEGAAFTVCLPRFQTQADAFAFASAVVAAGEGGGGHLAAPAPQPESPPAPAPSSAAEGDLTGVGTILLVEDEDAVRMFGSRALRNKGYTVLEAANGEEALEVINSTDEHIDLIVTDVVMPGMDGHTLVQFVRQEMPDVKVIFISGFSENVIPGGIQPGSGFAFLPKPFSLKDLAAKVKDVLAG